jgi:hypothetical protein
MMFGMRWLLGIGCLLVSGLGGAAGAAEPVDFNRQIRPILSAHCFKCHGPDEGTREAGLRLDVREAAIKPADSGEMAVVAGKPAASELVRRILADDADSLMPPPAANKPLSAEQKALLQTWIEQGAQYAPHWAFVPPVRPALPSVKQVDWPHNEVDYFILAKLEAAGLKPSPMADKYTLVRRAYLDLIGLPPTPAEADAFVNDPDPRAYERLIDRLLQSPHYGERWARRWLDLARYADTNGYEKDRPRSIWPYRDWVIRALNADMPFDQFTIEQLAGDMLPQATADQKIATGFHRNTMINEEGGIDPQEFRFYATVDRTNTTATTWLGLTLGCAQCHTHKFDPIPHRDYYSMLAFFNNADEPEFEVLQADVLARREEQQRKIAELEALLPERWPLPTTETWSTPRVVEAKSQAGAKLTVQGDGTVIASEQNPATDTYTIVLEADPALFHSLRIEALIDASLPSQGPGRTPHGNFVVTELAVTVAPAKDSQASQPLPLAGATADFAQENFPAAEMLDGNASTGWAIHGQGQWNVNRTATVTFAEPQKFSEPTRWTIVIHQDYGKSHTLGKFRLRLGSKRELPEGKSPELVRQEDRDAKFAAWQARESARIVDWRLLTPVQASSELPSLNIEPDQSIFASGDFSKRDVYDLKFKTDLPKIAAIKIEVLPDSRLPKQGPGRVSYEGPHGDFWLSEISLLQETERLKWKDASHSFANGKHNSAAAIDGDPQTGWSINGGQGREHAAVFRLAEPITPGEFVHLQLLFEKYFAAGLGRFRVWATDDGQAVATDLPAEVERIAKLPPESRSAQQQQQLLVYFCQQAPELSAERAKILTLKKQLPAPPTTLVLRERPADHPRATHLHHRGEYLQPKETVAPAVLTLIEGDTASAPRDRLQFARWLVDGKNPLTGRVTVNRHWAALFGRGLVSTTDDFGYQGASPSHPALLDWLALELPRRNWSIKELHKLILLSATYQQASVATAESTAKDPENLLLSHFPRSRIEAELIRDVVLKSAGLLSPKLGGPSVFPPQPAGVTSEGTYGPLAWNVSQGEDRYRRGLYTFSKRTAPYAMFLTFDGPSGEACVPRREISNSPLQALTLLNDQVFLEAAQKLGTLVAATEGDNAAKARDLFRRCLTRPPTDDEHQLVLKFFAQQERRLASQALDAATIAGPSEGDPVPRAAWTLVARALLNLDETITKN